MELAEVARVCHEANRAYCETLGDSTQPPWEDAPTWQQQSAIAGVRFHHEHPDATDADSHDEWLKTHPCMVAFDELPEHQRKKDRLFRLICKALL